MELKEKNLMGGQKFSKVMVDGKTLNTKLRILKNENLFK
jgi:hypothetical protein